MSQAVGVFNVTDETSSRREKRYIEPQLTARPSLFWLLHRNVRDDVEGVRGPRIQQRGSAIRHVVGTPAGEGSCAGLTGARQGHAGNGRRRGPGCSSSRPLRAAR